MRSQLQRTVKDMMMTKFSYSVFRDIATKRLLVLQPHLYELGEIKSL